MVQSVMQIYCATESLNVICAQTPLHTSSGKSTKLVHFFNPARRAAIMELTEFKRMQGKQLKEISPKMQSGVRIVQGERNAKGIDKQVKKVKKDVDVIFNRRLLRIAAIKQQLRVSEQRNSERGSPCDVAVQNQGILQRHSNNYTRSLSTEGVSLFAVGGESIPKVFKRIQSKLHRFNTTLPSTRLIALRQLLHQVTASLQQGLEKMTEPERLKKFTAFYEP